MEKISKELFFERIIVFTAYSFLAVPFIIFAIGFLKPLIGIPVVICICFSIFMAINSTKLSWVPSFSKKTIIKMVICIFIIVSWVFLSGIGKFVWQNSDHSFRNEIFELFVLKPWPVSSIINGIDHKMVYYIGFWLPAAIIGKVFGLQAGFIFQYIWAILGVFSMFFIVCSIKKKFLIRTLLIIIFFSGLDYIGQALKQHTIPKLISGSHDEWWAGAFQYSSMTTQIFWVFNQAIPAWVATALLLTRKNNKNMIFIMGVLLLNSTFPFMGLLPIVFYLIIANSKINEKVDLRNAVKSCISVQNIAGGGIAGILSFIFLASNVQSSNSSFVSSKIIVYYVFCVLEFGVYLFFIFREERKNPLYYVIAISLILFPLFYLPSGDFIMRASIPALFILMIMVSEKIETCKKTTANFVLLLVFLIGSITPLHEMTRTVVNTYRKSNVDVFSEEFIMTYPNFMGDSQKFFFKYIAK